MITNTMNGNRSGDTGPAFFFMFLNAFCFRAADTSVWAGHNAGLSYPPQSVKQITKVTCMCYFKTGLVNSIRI